MRTVYLACNIVTYYQEVTQAFELTMARIINVLSAEVTSAAGGSNEIG
jgi:hypothetical protein